MGTKLGGRVARKGGFTNVRSKIGIKSKESQFGGRHLRCHGEVHLKDRHKSALAGRPLKQKLQTKVFVEEKEVSRGWTPAPNWLRN